LSNRSSLKSWGLWWGVSKLTQERISFKLGFYPIFITAYLGGTLEHAVNHFNSYTGKINIEITGAVGKTAICDEDKGQLFMWVHSKKDIPSLVHEASHLVFFANDILGCIFTPDSQETFCYAVQEIVSKCLKGIKL